MKSDPKVAVAAAGFAAFVNLYALQSLLPTLAEVFQASHQATSLTVTASTLSIALASPWAGGLATHFERRRLVGTCLRGLVCTTLLGAASPSLAWLIFWRFLQGLFLPPVVASVMSLVAEEWSGPQVGRVMSNYVTWTVVGGFSGRFAAGLAGAHWGWRSALVLSALLNAIAGLVVMASLPARPATRRQQSGEILRFLVDPRFQAAFLSGFNALFSLVALFTYVTFYLADAPFHLGPAALGGIFCVYLVGMFITPLVGLVMGRLGFRLTLMLAALAGGTGAALTLAPSLLVVMAGLALASSGAFVSQAATSGYITTISGEQRTTALGLYLGFYYLGGSAGAALPGFLWQTGGWPACVALLMLVQGATWFTVRFGFQRSPGMVSA